MQNSIRMASLVFVPRVVRSNDKQKLTSSYRQHLLVECVHEHLHLVAGGLRLVVFGQRLQRSFELMTALNQKRDAAKNSTVQFYEQAKKRKGNVSQKDISICIATSLDGMNE